MILYNIYFHDGSGNRDYVATTNNLDKWLEANNERRISEGSEPESLDDFEIKEANAYIYGGVR
tara:strand:+ start:5438 stop:5626 length:189 start_codon:yes stop_codon:yes gene_type:complete